jgi:hypothetical protein
LIAWLRYQKTVALPADPAQANDYDSLAESYTAENETSLMTTHADVGFYRAENPEPSGCVANVAVELDNANVVLAVPRCSEMSQAGLLSRRTACRQSSFKELMMNLALWIAAGLLAFVFLVSSAKLFVPKEKMAGMGGASRWIEDFSPSALKAIGALELLGAVGLILPAALDIAPILVPLAATGAVVLFVGAVITRLRRGEKVTIVVDLVYLALAAFVGWGRFGPESFTG